MSNVSKKMLMAAAGAAGGGSVTVDQVFSTDLWTGTGAARSISNGLDMTEGGLVWFKSRNGGVPNALFDTEQGVTKYTQSNSALGTQTASDSLVSFNSNGFNLGADTALGAVNWNNFPFASWSFRSAPKFFDIQTWTGNGVAGREISHNLNCDVGMLLVKCTSEGNANTFWATYHRGSSNTFGVLNKTNAFASTNEGWPMYNIFGDDTSVILPTSTAFTVSGNNPTNETNKTYVAYIFADNSSENAADRLISCGSYTEGSSEQEISLGFEPQFLIVKTSTSTMGWRIFDTMRGFNYANVGTTVGASNANLEANSSNAESGSSPYFKPTPTGFLAPSGFFGSGTEYIFMAVRRDNQAEVTDATKVFAVDRANGSDNPCFVAGFPVDFGLLKEYNATGSWQSSSRLTSTKILSTNSNGAESSNGFYSFASNTSWFSLALGSEYYSWMWQRAKSFFDVLAYSGTYPAPTLSHSLSTVPEMVVFKSRESCGADDWYTFHTSLGTSKYVALNSNAASTTRNSWITLSNSSVTGDPLVSQTGTNYIMYLFASLAGVSKVSSVVHSGTTNVDAGFSNGSRFILLKRTDASGDWLTYDSTRGIVSGNDPYLLLNSDAAQVTNTDYIDPYSAGFTLTSSLTAGTYIYYAIA